MGASRDIVIVGFSGFGKEVHWLASRLGLKIRGFLDDNNAVLGEKFGESEVLGNVSSWTVYQDCQFVIAVGNPRVREKIHAKMLSGGTPFFATLIDPSAILNINDVEVGSGSIICAGTICTVNIKIGSHVIVNLNCTIGHDVLIEDFVTIAPMAAISGNVHVADKVEVGTGACIRQGVSLETGSMLGMGSVLTKSIKENVVFFGNPAKFFKTISE